MSLCTEPDLRTSPVCAETLCNPIAEADFDADIAVALTASGWRAAACLLAHAALSIEAGDYLSAERNRQRAREQFLEANDLFKLFQEVQRRAGVMAEDFQ